MKIQHTKVRGIMNESLNVILILLLPILILSCKKFLDAKPTSNLSKLSISDLQGLLDDYDTMNFGYPADGEASSDNYFLLDPDYNAIFNPDDKDFYIWKAQAQRHSSSISSWTSPYLVVYNANLVLETLNNDATAGSLDQQTANILKGSAFFFRGYAHFQMAQLYAKPYNNSTASQDLGIPIRTSTAVATISDRGTVQQTYDKIITDIQNAISLLPVTSTSKSRPNKVAAYAALARIYLAMEDYTNAGKMADECLKLYSTLIDYKTISTTSLTPFQRFNSEVIFQSTTEAKPPLNPRIAKINIDLYNSYDVNDLRKKIFFKTVIGGFKFSGNYEPTTASSFFNGLATDEIYLIRAECNARAGNTTLAMADLNTLLRNRWSGTYIDMTATSADEALTKILTERRKELIFRCLRWSDLRRLNKDARFQVTLTRTIQGTTYSLPPNDLRYILLIPQPVLENTGFQQNPR